MLATSGLVLRSVIYGTVVRPATDADLDALIDSPHGAIWAEGQWCYIGTAELE